MLDSKTIILKANWKTSWVGKIEGLETDPNSQFDFKKTWLTKRQVMFEDGIERFACSVQVVEGDIYEYQGLEREKVNSSDYENLKTAEGYFIIRKGQIHPISHTEIKRRFKQLAKPKRQIKISSKAIKLRKLVLIGLTLKLQKRQEQKLEQILDAIFTEMIEANQFYAYLLSYRKIAEYLNLFHTDIERTLSYVISSDSQKAPYEIFTDNPTQILTINKEPITTKDHFISLHPLFKKLL